MNLLKVILLLNVSFVTSANALNVVKDSVPGQPIDLPKGAVILGSVIDSDRIPGQPIDRPKAPVLSSILNPDQLPGQPIDRPKGQVLSQSIGTTKDNGIIDPPRDQIILGKSIGGTKKDIIDPPRGGSSELILAQASVTKGIDGQWCDSNQKVFLQIHQGVEVSPYYPVGAFVVEDLGDEVYLLDSKSEDFKKHKAVIIKTSETSVIYNSSLFRAEKLQLCENATMS